MSTEAPTPDIADAEYQRVLLNGILNASQDAIFVLGAIRNETGVITDFHYTHSNTAVGQLFGYSPQQLSSSTFLTLYPGARAAGLFDAYCRVADTGESFQTETYYNTDGLDCWYNILAVKLGDGLVINVKDISDRKAAELQLLRQADENKRQSELMQAMLDGALNGVLLLEPVYDESGNVTDFMIRGANPAVKDLTGADPQQAIGRTMQQVYPGYKQAGFFARYCHALQTGEPQRVENYYEDDQLKGWFEVSAVRQRFDDTGYGIVLTFSNVTHFRMAQERMETLAEERQTVLDATQTGIFLFSPVYDETGQHVDFRFKSINRMVAALVGQTPGVLTGALASDWFISYRETGLFDAYRRTLETGDEQRFTIHYDVDDFDVWFDVKAIRMGGDVLVTFTDFTDLKKAQQEVERQAELLESVLDSSTNGIMSFKSIRNEQGQIVDFQFVTVNEASERIVGVPVKTMLNNRLLNLFPGNVETGLFDLYVNTVETGEPGRIETYYNHDGLDFWLDITARKLGDGFVVTFSDTSIIKRASLAIERSAKELQTVIDTSQTGIFLFSPVRAESGEVVDFRFRVANRQLASYVGQEPEAVIGALGSQWFPDYKTNGLFERYLHTYLTGETLRFDFHYDGSGIDVWLDIMSSKMNDDVLVTFADYTPMKQLQQRLENLVIDLQRSNRNLEQFAYVASHDLQEPLRKIRAFGDIVETRYGPLLGDEGADMVRRMQSAAARMQTLIKDVLAYSRVATKREETVPVALNELIAGVLTDLETAIFTKQAHIQVNELPVVKGDAAQLRQLFQNLISNALKFARADVQPVITLSARQVVASELTDWDIAAKDRGRTYHLIEVTDNGIGFDAHQRERIFQVFQRLHGRSQYEGNGIGLAVVQKVVDNHQGYVQAEGRPGAGATFRVLLPAG